MAVLKIILKFTLYLAPFLVALTVLWVGLGVGLIMEPTAGTILVAAALLAAALNVGWIVAYKRK